MENFYEQLFGSELEVLGHQEQGEDFRGISELEGGQLLQEALDKEHTLWGVCAVETQQRGKCEDHVIAFSLILNSLHLLQEGS